MTGETIARKRVKALSFVMPGTLPYRVQCYPPNHPLLTQEPDGFTHRLNRLISQSETASRMERIFVPGVEHMSARRARFSEFSHTCTLDNRAEVYESANPSDVVALRARQGVFFRSGGCLLVVATGGGYCIAGHAGRDSLICLPGTERAHESVMHAIAESFDRKGVARSNVMIRTFFGLQPDVFVHDPASGVRSEYYEAVLDYARRLQERIDKKAMRLAIRQWSSREQIIRMKDGVPHLSLYHLLKAHALLLEIYNVGNEKPLPIDENFAYTRHSVPSVARDRNWVFAFRE